MQQTCRQCSAGFEITDEDLSFYDKVSPVFNGKKELIPPPTLCPDCRDQRRLAQMNRIYLYRRKSSATNKDIISIYSPEKALIVYENEIWFGDSWDPLDYGQTPDFSKPIFVQLQSLLHA